MNWITALAVVLLCASTYLAGLNLALHRKRRATVQARFEEAGKAQAGTWLATHRDSVLFALTLLQTACRMAFFCAVLIDIVGFGESAILELTDLLLAGGISVVLLWLATSVVSLALAKHAGVGLLYVSYPFLRGATVVGHPLNRALSFVDEAVRRLSGANLRESDAVEEELLRSIEETHLEGAIDPDAAEMLENVVEFASTEVGEVMTPRTDIEGIELTNDLAEIRDFILRAGHSRIPVYEDDLDHILGILYVKDLVQFLGSEPDSFDLSALLRKPIVVPESKALRDLLTDFQKSEVHLAIVIDEYGGTAGLVTIEDVLEEIVGEIHDEHEPDDDEEPKLATIDEQRALVDGRYHLDDINEELGIELPEDDDYETVAGFVLAKLGRVPEVGESLQVGQVNLTVQEATETHIQKILIEFPARPVTVEAGSEAKSASNNG